MDFIADIIISFLFRYPGAFLFWLFSRKEKSFKEVLAEGADDTYGYLGLLFIIGIIALIVQVVKSV